MRFFSKALFALFFIATILLVAAYIFIQTNGHRLLTAKLNEAFQRPVTIGEVRLSFPLSLRIDNFNMEGAIQAREVRIHLGILSLMEKVWHISSLTMMDPLITLQRIPGEGIGFGTPAVAKDASSPQEPVAEAARKGFPVTEDKTAFILDSLLIKGGKILYVDESVDQGMTLTIEQIDLLARDIGSPERPVNTKYNLTAVVTQAPMNFAGSRVESNGWINWPAKDMDAELMVTDNSQQLALKADLKSKNNDMLVKGKINIANLTAVRPEPPEGRSASLQDMIFEGLKSSGVAIVLDFQFKTKMDDFQVGTVAVSGNVDYQQPKKSVIDDFKNIGKQLGGKKKEEPEKPAETKTVPVETAPASAE